LSASRRLDALTAAGVEFVAGVPCGYLQSLFAACLELPPSWFLPAVREDHAVSACAGAWLGGRRALAAMPGGGLGRCLQALATLNVLHCIPLLLVASDRGREGESEGERVFGSRVRETLNLFELPWREAQAGQEEAEAAWLVETAERYRRPAVLLVGRGLDS
jgi:sulfopyruvate decarboxylase subunit alpha